MTTITEVPEQVQVLLTQEANRLARQTGFIQRQRQLTGAGFVQALVFGQLAQPQATRRQLHQKLLCSGVVMSCQGMDKRFSPQAEAFLQAMVVEVLCQQHPQR